MMYHCKVCGGFLRFWEEPKHYGRVYHCDCNKCGNKIVQISKGFMVSATVISNVKL